MSKTIRKQQSKDKKKWRMLRKQKINKKREFLLIGMIFVVLFSGCAVTKVQINLAHKDVEIQVEMR